MQKMTKLAAAIALASSAIAAPAMAEGVSANVGFVSDYYYRGLTWVMPVLTAVLIWKLAVSTLVFGLSTTAKGCLWSRV